MIMYATDHKQIVIPMLNIIVMQILNTIVIQTLNTTVIITTPFVTILAKVTVVKTLILEDVADIEDNMINTLKAYSTKMYYRLLSYITRILLIHQNTVSLNVAPNFYQEFILLKYSMAFGVKPM